jgi:hypothetical protein
MPQLPLAVTKKGGQRMAEKDTGDPDSQLAYKTSEPSKRMH